MVSRRIYHLHAQHLAPAIGEDAAVMTAVSADFRHAPGFQEAREGGSHARLPDADFDGAGAGLRVTVAIALGGRAPCAAAVLAPIAVSISRSTAKLIINRKPTKPPQGHRT